MNSSESDSETSQFQELVKRVASARGISSYDIDVKVGSIKGDNYMGKIYRLTIRGDDTLNLIMKVATDNESVREQMPIRKASLREIFMYDRVFKEFENFQQNIKLPSCFTPYPKCHHTILDEGQETLVLEDLNECGYRMWNRKKTMNEDHISMVLRTYGKFHALSFALKDQNPKLFAEIASRMRRVFGHEEEKGFFNLQVKHALELFDANTESDVVRALEMIGRKFGDVLAKLRTPDELSAFIHGDSWCNNMMFKYKGQSQPIVPSDICLIDFQFSNVGSVVLDLSYFIYSCTSKEVFSQLDKYIKIYYDSLSSFMGDLGSHAEKFFSFEDLKGEWQKYCLFGFLVSVTIIRLMLFEADQVPDVEKLTVEKNFFETLYGDSNRVQEEYRNRIRDLLHHLAENKFI